MSLETIPCISIQQPYASAVFWDGKWCENRSWFTAHRGELWIHASKVDQPSIDAAKKVGFDLEKNWPDKLHTQAIIGRVQMLRCVPGDHLLAAASEEACKILEINPDNRPPINPENSLNVEFLQAALADVYPVTWSHFLFAKYAWIFGTPEYLDAPIFMPGKQGVWKVEVDPDLLVLANIGDDEETSG